MTWKVVATFQNEAIPVQAEGIERIGAAFTQKRCTTEDEIIELAGDADAVITQREPFTLKVIEKLPDCRIIAVVRTGYDNVDVEAATAHGICVSTGGSYCSEEVAIHTMALLLTLARKILPIYEAAKEGYWGAPTMHTEMRRIWKPMFRLDQQTLGIVGLGNIGRSVVPKAKGFGLKVVAHDPYVDDKVFQELGVERVDFKSLLEESDYISINASLNEETYRMFGLAELKRMKPTAFLINTARGDIIDQEALCNAVTQGYIAGAGLDAVVPEPLPVDHPLLHTDNIIVTAHSAFYSETAFPELGRRAVQEVIRILSGEWPVAFVNPEVKGEFQRKWGKR